MIPKQRRRLVVTTGAHIIYGYAYMHEEASLTAFVDSTDPEFMPMTNVRVRWLADRRLAGRFPFALVQRRKIIGIATEVSGGLSLLRGRGGRDLAPSDRQAAGGAPPVPRSVRLASSRLSQTPNPSAPIAGTANQTASSASASRTIPMRSARLDSISPEPRTSLTWRSWPARSVRLVPSAARFVVVRRPGSRRACSTWPWRTAAGRRSSRSGRTATRAASGRGSVNVAVVVSSSCSVAPPRRASCRPAGAWGRPGRSWREAVGGRRRVVERRSRSCRRSARSCRAGR